MPPPLTVRIGAPSETRAYDPEYALAGDCSRNRPSVMMRRAAVQAVGGYHAEFAGPKTLISGGAWPKWAGWPICPRSSSSTVSTRDPSANNTSVSPWRAGGSALPDANLHRRRTAGVRAGDYRVALHSGVQAVAPVPGTVSRTAPATKSGRLARSPTPDEVTRRPEWRDGGRNRLNIHRGNPG